MSAPSSVTDRRYKTPPPLPAPSHRLRSASARQAVWKKICAPAFAKAPARQASSRQLKRRCLSTEAGRHKDAWSSLELDYKNRHPDAEPAEEASKYLKDNLVSVGLEAVFMENKGFLAKEASVYA